MSKRLLLAAAACVACSAYAGVNQWTSVGPDGTSAYGGVTYLARANQALVVTTRGIYRTTDSGLTWTRTRSLGIYPVFNGVAANPNPASADQVLAHGGGTTEILRSVDGGATWTPVAVGANDSTVTSAAFSRNGQVAWAGLANGAVYRSTDAGATWTPSHSGLTTTSPIAHIAVDATDPLIVYLQSATQLWRTIDGGGTWSRIGGADFYVNLVASPTTHNLLLVTRFDSTSEIYRSVDAGLTFTATGLDNATGAIAFDPANAGRAWAADGDRRVHVSNDDGASWTPRGTVPPGTPMELASDASAPDRLIMATNAGIAFSNDGGLNWIPRHAGIREAYFGRLVAGHAPSDYVYATSYDGNHLYRRDPATAAWTAIGAAADSTVLTTTNTAGVEGFAETANGARQLFIVRDGRVGRSDDDGAHWQALGSVAEARSLTLDPVNPLVAYLGNYNSAASKTLDGGVTWSALAGGLPAGVDKLLVDPSSPDILYAGRDALRTLQVGKVFRSVDAGANWTQADTLMTGDYLWRLAMHPTRPSTLYAGLETGLWKTVDAGASWSNVYAGNAFDVAVDPQSPEILYVSSRSAPYGTARSVDGGATWETLNAWTAGGVSADPLNLVLVPGQPSTLILSRTDSGLWEIEIAPDVRISAATTALVMDVPQTVNYHLINDGAQSATAVAFSLSLPPATGVSVNSGNVSCTQGTQSVSCTVPVLRPGTSLPITLSLTPSAPDVELRAIVSGYEPDSSVGNNVLDIATERRANLRALLTSSTDAAQTGNAFTYSLNLANLGPSSAANVVADLQLPANVRFSGVTTSGLACVQNAGLVRCTAASVAVNAGVEAHVVVDAITAGAATAMFTVTGEGTDTDAANNVMSKVVTLTDPPPPSSGSSSSSSSSSSSGGGSSSSSSSSSSSGGGASGGGGGGGGRFDWLALALLGSLAGALVRRRSN